MPWCFMLYLYREGIVSMKFTKIKNSIVSHGIQILFIASTLLINLLVISSGSHSWFYKTPGLLAYPINLMIDLAVVLALAAPFSSSNFTPRIYSEENATNFVKKLLHCISALVLLDM